MSSFSVNTTALNVRSTPSTKKKPVATILKGSLWIGTGEASGDWVEGRSSSGAQGWVHKIFISTAPRLAPVGEVHDGLKALGWRTDTAEHALQSIKDFQAMYNLSGAPLGVDGKVGRNTTSALREAVKLGRISEHFKASEFRCKCRGKHADCHRISVPRATLVAAERLRTVIGPFTPISACRCPHHNDHVGGYARSQHVYGLAMDIPAVATPEQLRPLNVFSGFGVQGSTGKVRHVDLRHLSPDNHPKATLKTPRIYKYA